MADPPAWRAWVHRHSTRLYGPSPTTTWLSWIGDERIAIGHLPTGDSIGLLAEAGVLIHCQQGRRRSVLVGYAVLRLRGHGESAAAELIGRHRREAVLVPAYRSSVEDWLAEK